MKEQIIKSRLSPEEKETIYYINYGEDTVLCESTIPRDFNRCEKKGWTVIERTLYEDGTIAGMVLEAPRSALSIRKADRPKRVLSDEHKAKLLQSKNNSNSDNFSNT